MTTAERSNRTKIRDECIARSRGDCTVKTKTKTIIAKLDNETYKREPIKFIKFIIPTGNVWWKKL